MGPPPTVFAALVLPQPAKSLGHLRLDEISVSVLRDWWQVAVHEAKRSPRTGRVYLNSIAQVLRYAMEHDLATSRI